MPNYYLLSQLSVQDKNNVNEPDFTDIQSAPKSGRLLSLDLGSKKVGVAVSDELQLTVRRVKIIKRAGWKKFLIEIANLIEDFDAKALVVGLPVNFDGSESEMSADARRLARNFSLSLRVPVYLQDERTTTFDARGRLWEQKTKEPRMKELLDSEAAAIILEDFIAAARRQETK